MTAPLSAPLLAYYGDDFTGSTDVLESMTAAGVPSVLLLDAPAPALLERFRGARCIGLAGTARSRSPAWMDAELPPVFAALRGLGAPILQYKVCSTFDSAPAVGSIGHAADLGAATMPGRWMPVVVGAPRLGRYLAFGNLFAAADGRGYRIDRHPTMSRHPVTPMTEADLRLHLRAQTARRIELIDFVQLRRGAGAERLRELEGSDQPIVLLDVVDDATLIEAGRLIWEQRGAGLFSPSSSGLNDALAAHWREAALIPARAGLAAIGPSDGPVAAVSGSCSPGTAAQIGWARRHGFVTERLDLARALGSGTFEAEIERLAGIVLDARRRGASALVFSAEGPADPAVTGFDRIAAQAGLERNDAARQVGRALAAVLKQVLERSDVRRVAVAGGDSSGEVASTLGIAALEVAAALVPGSPLCRGWRSAGEPIEIALKGGQMGGADFFGLLRDGTT